MNRTCLYQVWWTEENDELNLQHLRSIKKKNPLQEALVTYDKIRLSINGTENLKCVSWLTNSKCLGASLSFPGKGIPRNNWQWFPTRRSHILLGPSLHVDTDDHKIGLLVLEDLWFLQTLRERVLLEVTSCLPLWHFKPFFIITQESKTGRKLHIVAQNFSPMYLWMSKSFSRTISWAKEWREEVDGSRVYSTLLCFLNSCWYSWTQRERATSNRSQNSMAPRRQGVLSWGYGDKQNEVWGTDTSWAESLRLCV